MNPKYEINIRYTDGPNLEIDKVQGEDLIECLAKLPVLIAQISQRRWEDDKRKLAEKLNDDDIPF